MHVRWPPSVPVILCVMQLGGLYSCARADTTAAITISVRTDKKFQVIENFGASGAWSCDPIGRKWSDENKQRIADLLFSTQRGIGLSLWRFNMGAGSVYTHTIGDQWRSAECFKKAEDAPYDWTCHAGQQWFLKAARHRDVQQFLACAYSPPVWMTVNGCAHGDAQTGSTNLRPGYERQFAKFFGDVLDHFAAKGLPFQFVSPVNEPNWAWDSHNQEGCRYNNDDWKRVVDALATDLAARGLKTAIIAPEAGDVVSLLDDDRYRKWSGSKDPTAVYTAGNQKLGKGAYRQYLKVLFGDPAMRPTVDGRISAHSYWTDSGKHSLKDLRTILQANLSHYGPDLRYWQTEYCVMKHGRDLGMDTALHVAKVIHYDLTAANASAWHWWTAVSAADFRDGLIYTDYRTNGRQNVVPSKTLWVLGNYSRYIRPHARRIAAEPSEDGEGLYASAYLEERGKSIVVVLVNESKNQRRARLDFDRPICSLTPCLTSANDSLAEQPSVAGGESIAVPARSVMTVIAR